MKKTLAFDGDPFAVFKKFYGRPGLFFLDSSLKAKDSRHSFLGFEPFEVIHDLNRLKSKMAHNRRKTSGLFSGGAVGYLSYDGECVFGLYDQVLVFDHAAKTLTIHAKTPGQIKRIVNVLKNGVAHVPVIRPFKKDIVFKSNFNKDTYAAAVRKALDHIAQGDIYQINLSRKIDASLKNWKKHADPVAVYEALRRNSPSPFAAYFDDGRQVILSSSPERFLKLSGKTAQVKPMKGTRPRGQTKQEDRRLKQELLKSPKEIAELLMVTDLERNDLGRVCTYGSVKVRAMRTIEEYQTVFQATATVEGELHKAKDAFDLLKATFPGGSVTGCPKIEAMNIIKRLEKTPRGNYTGALGYIGFDGNMDFSVLIRSLFLQEHKISFHVGGGIVADSNPASEYEETCVKAKAMEKTLTEVFCG